ncbi:hypothetical protein B0H34DRAFT_791957 [Crassisporium funariophilum]|nr:hypothetical protein B0H34DRAFT_791957 [Crassisporium funariophilum]
MKAEGMSANHLTRYPATQIHIHRSPISSPSASHSAGQILLKTSRRKRVADTITVSGDTDSEDSQDASSLSKSLSIGSSGNVSQRVFRLRTNSTTSTQTIRAGSTTANTRGGKKAVLHVAAQEASASLTSWGAGDIASTTKSRSKSKPRKGVRTTSSVSSSAVPKAKVAPATSRIRKKKVNSVNNSGLEPDNLSSSNVNEGNATIASGTLTHTTSSNTTSITHSYFETVDYLDDPFRWDMDSLPSIPSPPASPIDPNDSSSLTHSFASTTPTSDTPFSTPIDEDAATEHEGKLPLFIRKTPVNVHDRMNITKAKQRAKGRGSHPTNPTISRHIVLSGPNTLPGLPHPLPLRTVNQNLNAHLPHPLADAALAELFLRPDPSRPSPPFSSSILSSQIPRSISSSSGSTSNYTSLSSLPSSTSIRTDAWGSMQLTAADCELSVTFPQTSHYEVWDMKDDAFVACPLLLNITAKDAFSWSGRPLALPNITLIDIRCDDIPIPTPFSSPIHTEDEYTVQCTDTTDRGDDCWQTKLNPRYSSEDDKVQGKGLPGKGKNKDKDFAVVHNRISIEGRWVKTYARPGVEGPSMGRMRWAPRHDRYSFSSEVGTEHEKCNLSDPDNGSTPNGRGWFLKFWIPVPTRLFRKRETRAFDIRASVWMAGDEERLLSMGMGMGTGLDSGSEDGEGCRLITEAEMTVSHLRREREMDRMMNWP